MIGLSEALAADLAARGYTEADVARLFGPLAYRGEVSVVYARPNGDRTSPLPSSLHRYYTAKGFTAVEIIDPPADAENAESVVPDVILDHGRNDRVGTWTRGTDSLESSCRNASALLAKGWAFAGLSDEKRLRAVAEGRPWPPADLAVDAPAEVTEPKHVSGTGADARPIPVAKKK